MRALAAILLALAGCASTGTYTVRDEREGVGVAVSTESLLSVIHPPYVGQRVRVCVRGYWVEAKVVHVGFNGLVELRGTDGPLDLRPGDSGSPVALLIGRR